MREKKKRFSRTKKTKGGTKALEQEVGWAGIIKYRIFNCFKLSNHPLSLSSFVSAIYLSSRICDLTDDRCFNEIGSLTNL